MSIHHKVRQGECLSSIARRYDFDWQTIWNHGDNADLKAKRKNPGILYPGDVVVIPDVKEKKIPAATTQHHVFKMKTPKARLRVRMLCNDEPIKNEPYELTIDDGPATSGSTDGDGMVEADIDPLAWSGKLRFPKRFEEYDLELGHLDPIDEVTGIQARLSQLDYYDGAITGTLDEATEQAIKAFQEKRGLSPTGKPDGATKSAIVADYGH